MCRTCSTVAVLATAAIAMVAIALIVGYNTRHLTANIDANDHVQSSTMQGYYLGQLLIGALGVLFVTGEYSTGMIRSTFAAVPKRLPVLWAKLVVFVVVTAITMIASCVVVFVSSQALISAYRPGDSLGDPGVLRVVIGTGVYLTLIGVIGAALGWIVRSTPGSLVAYIAVMLVLPILFGSVLGTWGKRQSGSDAETRESQWPRIWACQWITRSGSRIADTDQPVVEVTWRGPAGQLAMLIAVGIGLHNFAEGLAIGNSAAAGDIALAVLLIIGFGLHNATEGFGIVAPMAAAGVRPSWGQLAVLGLVGGGPTFLGTVLGQHFTSDITSIAFLSLAAGSILYVVIELLAVARRMTFKLVTTWGIFLGLVLGFVTDAVVTAGGA